MSVYFQKLKQLDNIISLHQKKETKHYLILHIALSLSHPLRFDPPRLFSPAELGLI